MASDSGVGERQLIWLRPERTRRGPRPTLSREEITRAAIGLADREGLDSVSMRRIAGELGAGTTSLYWYVDSKDDLFELMVDEVIGEIELPRASADWRADLRVLAERTHAVLTRHNWLVLLGIQPGLGPKTQRYGEAALAILDRLDADLRTQINILAALNNYIFGFVHREIAADQLRRRSGLTDKQWRARLRTYLQETSTQDATLAQHAEARLGLTDEASFLFGLDCLIDGVAARLKAP